MNSPNPALPASEQPRPGCTCPPGIDPATYDQDCVACDEWSRQINEPGYVRTINGFARVTSYGQPVTKGFTGSYWRHACGNMTAVDLLADPVQPWDRECAGCRSRGRNGWRILLTYSGPYCDQCDGNGWVPISGKNDGAAVGYDTVTECTACDGMGWGR